MNSSNEKLRKLKQKHGLTLKDISNITGVSLSTVTSYFRHGEHQRKCPAYFVEYLEMKIKENKR